ncbi:ROK family protein [Mucilaginibacter sabulilitoris]|uniref:ROK family protein n=1 Tax=Mucilaginibacter sabulilitoris TaxID=1173583 RepID=A0ABZ0TY87_9SPHI|nr:ROK family protein [Mucilaginibacter sabulilitoris]WPU97023.1 ROK family protein [Mucilaginibacter sabulilitoris]
MQTQHPPPHVLTADIGGSHLTAGIANFSTNAVIPESVISAEVMSKGTAKEILHGWIMGLQAVMKINDHPLAGLAVAMPGPFDYDRGISYIKGLDKYEAIFGMDIKRHLADALAMEPDRVRFRNDAECAIAGEVLAGAGKGYNKVIGITLGTGFGSAFSVEKITKDLNLGSDPHGSSIADDYFSTRWFVKRYAALRDQLLTGGVKELAALAEKSDQAKQVFDEFADGLGAFLLKVTKKLQPEVLVIGGNIAGAADLFLPRLKRNLGPLPVRLGQLGAQSPLIGAAAIFKEP